MRYTEDRAFATVFANMQKAKKPVLEYEEVILRLMPKICEYAELHQGTLAPGMLKVYEAGLKIQQFQVEFGVTELTNKGITLEMIEAQNGSV